MVRQALIFDLGSAEVEFKRHDNSEAPSVSSYVERRLFRPDLYYRLYEVANVIVTNESPAFAAAFSAVSNTRAKDGSI